MHIAAQNAGIIIRPTSSDVIFEAFELSPSNEAVYSTPGRLRRYFPEDAVGIPYDKFDAIDFKSTIASTLTTMSHEPVPEMQPRVTKANTQQVEERDTAKPFIVTNLFMAILQGVGGSQVSVPGFWKNTREEVVWSNGNKLSWHRSPVWLLLRVVLQQTLSLFRGAEVHDCGLYKRYMVFLMSKIMAQCLDSDIDSDALVVMNTKIGQRLLKLDTQEEEPWLAITSAVVRRANEALRQRWEVIIAEDTKTLIIPRFAPHETMRDLVSPIPLLDNYLENIPQRVSRVATDFVPPTLDISSLASNVLPPCSFFDFGSSEPNALYKLASFESWVKTYLNLWITNNGGQDNTCARLRDIIEAYNAAASAAYQGYPEGVSSMFLTIVELWIACDKSSIRCCPLIADYKPEIPIAPLRSLLIKFSDDMQWLFEAERYLAHRNDRATCKRSILFNLGQSSDFGVRFFSSSAPHQSVLRRIEQDATHARTAKIREFQTLKERHRELVSEASRLTCTYHTITDAWGDNVRVHDGACHKCALNNEAKTMKIQAHEWPLPDDQILAHAVVFELQTPGYFGAWRDCTLFVLQKVLCFTSAASSPGYICRVSKYDALSHHYQQHSSKVTIELFSEAKPHAQTHRREKYVGIAEESDVCLDTGPRWTLLNSLSGEHLERPIPSHHISKVCTLKLDGPSRDLQVFLTRSWGEPDGVAPNHVIAGQGTCPQHLTMDEFKALCSLPLGRYTAWPNLLTQLAMPSLDLNKAETLAFVWQLAEQCGPRSGTWRRATHERLEDTEFLCKCLCSLKDSLSRVKESWESRIAVAVFTLLAARLLSVGCGSVSSQYLGFLSDCRAVSCDWQRTLRHKAFSSQAREVRLDLSQRAGEAALICLSSFDVDNKHLARLLRDSDAVKFYLESLIALRDTEFSFSDNNLTRFQLHSRCRRLIWRCHQVVIDAITNNDNSGLDLAIQATWAGFQRAHGYSWRNIKTFWLCTQAEAVGEGASTLSVHFNLVTGELLVNGLPRGRLPAQNEQHKMYKKLFGHAAFEAMPSSDPKMCFTASKLFRGFELQFRLDAKDNDLVIRATKGGQMWELLPNRIFNKILPFQFVKDFVYWYDVGKSEISLLSSDNPWGEDDRRWTMQQSGSEWRVRDGTNNHLVFPSKSTAKVLGAIFEPLEELWGLNILFNGQSKAVSIHRPRLNLDFSVDAHSDRIHSRQYKGMYVDSVQGIKTLIGLKSKLVLCRSDGTLISHMILVPDAMPSMSLTTFSNGQSHPSVEIEGISTSVQPYHLNQYLGTLRGNGSLKSLLFIAELHAMTSGIVPDPFTGVTGTEEALGILNSAAVRSLEIGEAEAQILERISRLSPARYFYPKHVKQMQIATWNSVMSPIAQSDLFAIVALKLSKDAEKMECFRQTPFPKVDLTRGSSDLARRSSSRSLFVYDVDSHVMPAPSDLDYQRQPQSPQTMRERTTRAIRFGSALRLGDGILPHDGQFDPSAFYDILKSPLEPTPGARLVSRADIQYNARLLESTCSFLPSLWCSLHQALAKNEHGCGQTQLISWLATLAFARDAHHSCLQALLGFACLPAMEGIEVPSKFSYTLAEGHDYQAAEIRNSIKEAKHGFASSAESRLTRGPNESNRTALLRRQTAYEKEITKESNAAEASIRLLWPCRALSEVNVNTAYFKRSKASTSINHCIQTWFHNLQFFQYLEEVCGILNNADMAEIEVSLHSLVRVPFVATGAPRRINLLDLLDRMPAPAPNPVDETLFHCGAAASHEQNATQSRKLEQLSMSLRAKATSRHESLYLDQFDESISCLRSHAKQLKSDSCDVWDASFIQSLLATCRDQCASTLEQIRAVLSLDAEGAPPPSHGNLSWRVAAQTQIWPILSTRKLLALMSRGSWQTVPAGWKDSIIVLALCICDLQAIERLSKVKDNK